MCQPIRCWLVNCSSLKKDEIQQTSHTFTIESVQQDRKMYWSTCQVFLGASNGDSDCIGIARVPRYVLYNLNFIFFFKCSRFPLFMINYEVVILFYNAREISILYNLWDSYSLLSLGSSSGLKNLKHLKIRRFTYWTYTQQEIKDMLHFGLRKLLRLFIHILNLLLNGLQ